MVLGFLQSPILRSCCDVRFAGKGEGELSVDEVAGEAGEDDEEDGVREYIGYLILEIGDFISRFLFDKIRQDG